MDVKSLKVAELKDELSKRGLSTKGLKKEVGGVCFPADSELAERLQESLDQSVTRVEDVPEVAQVAEVAPVAESVPIQVEEQALESQRPPTPEPEPIEAEDVQPQPIEPAQEQATETEGNSEVPPTPVLDDENGPDAAPAAEYKHLDDQPSTRPTERSSDTVSLPTSLSHLALSYPPSKILYISNLRRPLLLSNLWELLEPTSLPVPPQAPHSSSSSPGLWLSGIKDHAYAGYETTEAALATAERVHNLVWPETSNAKLDVQFVDPAEVSRLLEEEQAAWKNRQKLDLRVTKEETGWSFELIQPGQTGPMRSAPRNIQPPVPGPVVAKSELRWTKTRPSLAWKEGPGAPPRPVQGGRSLGRGGARGGFGAAGGFHRGGFGGRRGGFQGRPADSGWASRGRGGGGDHWADRERGSNGFERRGRW